MTTDRHDHDIETPAQYRDRMARESLTADDAKLCTEEEDCEDEHEDDDSDDDAADEYADEADDTEDADGKGKSHEKPTAAIQAGKSLGELAALRPSTDEDGYDYPPVRLAVLPMAQKNVDSVKAETETLLNDLIGECGALLRDVAFRSACLTPDVSERIRFISAAESSAVTATKVADAIGRLRHGEPQVVDAHRHELIYTHVRATPPSPRRSGESSHQ